MKIAKFITAPNFSLNMELFKWNPILNGYNIPFEPDVGQLNLKKTFTIDKKSDVKKIILRSTALGIYDVYLNGKRVGETIDGEVVYDEYKPGWSDYRYRVFEYEYDITPFCETENLMTVVVSTGWWSGRLCGGAYGHRALAYACEIEIKYQNGENKIISTDGDWEAFVGGNIRRADLLDGEYYDATMPTPHAEPDFYTWEKAVVFDNFDGEIIPIPCPTVRAKKHLEKSPLSAVIYNGVKDNGTTYGEINVISKKIGTNCESSTLNKGEYLILDMGQNIVGRPAIKIEAKKGTKIEIFFAEMLNDSGKEERGNDGAKGSLYMRNYRSSLSRVIYFASGNGVEYYYPTHAFYGFRYIEIRTTDIVKIHSVNGQVIGSDIKETSSFSCDNPLINQLHSNSLWGMRGNYLFVPTDCPQRDERRGWSGDTQVFCGAASYLADINTFMEKWLTDASDSQKDLNGAYPDVIPNMLLEGSNAAWGDAGIIVAYRLWLMYSNKELLIKHYSSMEDYMKYISRNGLDGTGAAFGDWLAYEDTDQQYISICFYAYDALLMAKISKIISNSEKEAYYSDLHKRICKYWKEKYFVDGKITVKTQAAMLLPLYFDIADSDVYPIAVNTLKELIVNNGYRLTTGFVGTAILTQTLAKVGLYDLCYSLILQTNEPSWLFSILQGATTMWERWNSYTAEKGFGDYTMNSFNHYAYGAVVEWFYSGMCGIIPSETLGGFSKFTLAPTPDFRKDNDIPCGQKRINKAKASYDSINGTIKSEWIISENFITYNFTIPKGTSAEIKLITSCDAITINNILFTAEELSAYRENELLCFTLNSGDYVIKTEKY